MVVVKQVIVVKSNYKSSKRKHILLRFVQGLEKKKCSRWGENKGTTNIQLTKSEVLVIGNKQNNKRNK